MYEVIQRFAKLYELLADDISKELFKARLILDVEPSMTNAMHIFCLNETNQQDSVKAARRLAWKKEFKKITEGGKSFSSMALD